MTNSEHMKNKQDALDALAMLQNHIQDLLHCDIEDAPSIQEELDTIRAALSPETQGGDIEQGIFYDAYRALETVSHRDYSQDDFVKQYGTTPQYIQWKALEQAALQNNAQVDVEALWEDILENFDGHAESFSDVSLNILLYLQSKGHLRAIPEAYALVKKPDVKAMIDECNHDARWMPIDGKHIRMIIEWVFQESNWGYEHKLAAAPKNGE